jgi:hypothetical protein
MPCRSSAGPGPHHSAVITGIDAVIDLAGGKRGVAGPGLLCVNRGPPTQRQALRLVRLCGG